MGHAWHSEVIRHPPMSHASCLGAVPCPPPRRRHRCLVQQLTQPLPCTAAPSSWTATATRPTGCSGGTCISTSTIPRRSSICARCRKAGSRLRFSPPTSRRFTPVSYTHLRAHETRHDLVCRLL